MTGVHKNGLGTIKALQPHVKLLSAVSSLRLLYVAALSLKR